MSLDAHPIDAGMVLSAHARAAFEAAWRQGCTCPELAIVEENGRMRCQACGAPILKRRRVEAG